MYQKGIVTVITGIAPTVTEEMKGKSKERDEKEGQTKTEKRNNKNPS